MNMSFSYREKLGLPSAFVLKLFWSHYTQILIVSVGKIRGDVDPTSFDSNKNVKDDEGIKSKRKV